jgi:hypothetical protein
MLSTEEMAHILSRPLPCIPTTNYTPTGRNGFEHKYHCSFLDASTEYKRRAFDLVGSVFATPERRGLFPGASRVLQLPGTMQAIRYERGHATHPAREVALHLKTLPPSSRIDGNGIAFNIMPYFSHYIFLDHGPGRFAETQNGYPGSVSIPDLLAERPDAILLPDTGLTANAKRELGNGGFLERHVFCGAPYFPDHPGLHLRVREKLTSLLSMRAPLLAPVGFSAFG